MGEGDAKSWSSEYSLCVVVGQRFEFDEWVQVAEPERPDFIEFISECADDEDEVSLDDLLRAEEILTEAIAARQPDGDEDE